MKSSLSTTIWLVIVWTAGSLFGVGALAYWAGTHAAAESTGGSFPGGAAGMALLAAIAIGAVAALVTLFTLPGRVIRPASALVEFSERIASGDARAKLSVSTDDEFGLIAENLMRASVRGPKVGGGDTPDSLQRSIADLLALINQVSRGDLTLRGKVTGDALGSVVESVNSMLDGFNAVIERIRGAAGDVSTNASRILSATHEVNAGATQQDQEITNTSSAVEELTVSMKQVSNNAEASAEAARRALDAAEQGNRAVRDTLEGMQRIRSSVQASARKIKSLGDRSLEISDIINVINDITEQTNLLAHERRDRGRRPRRRRSGTRFRRRRRRSAQAGRTLPQRDERHRRADQGHSGGDQRGRGGHGRRHQGSGGRHGACRSGRKSPGSNLQRCPSIRRTGAGDFPGF